MTALFVLQPARLARDAAIARAPSRLQSACAKLRCFEYGPADSAEQLRNQVSRRGDPVATQHLMRVLHLTRATMFGALAGFVGHLALAWSTGAVAADIESAARTGMIGGMSMAAITAAMRHRHRVAAEIEQLLPRVQAGDTLLVWSGRDGEALRELAGLCERLGMATVLRG